MAKTTRQTALFGAEDWKSLYKTYKEADLQSYNFETIRKTFIDYLRQNNPETFNDFIESSEFIALLNLMAMMGQSLSFRNDLNTRENFLDTAERRDSVVNLAKLIGYTPKRNESAEGYLKVLAVSTTEAVIDYNRNNLNNVTVRWNDRTNDDWQEQFSTILNAALVNSQRIGNPGRSATITGIKTDEYELHMANGFLPVLPFNATVDGVAMDFEIVNGTSINSTSIYEPAPIANAQLNVLYRNDNGGFASANTGYFFLFKQGLLSLQNFSLSERIANKTVDINLNGINNNDVWLYKLDANSNAIEEWTQVENIYASNGNQVSADKRKYFSTTSRVDDQVSFNFGDGVFSEIPVGNYRAYVRQSNGLEYVINPEEMQNIDVNINYISRGGRNEVITFTVSLTEPVSNAQTRELIADIKRRAPARFYTQNRMVNGEDYNNFPYTEYGSIIKSKALNRSSIGTSRYLDLVDPTGKYSSINTFSDDGLIYRETGESSFTFQFTNKNDISSVFRNKLEPLISSRSVVQFYHYYFNRVDLSTLDILWNQNTAQTNETSGYFKSSAGNAQAVGSYVNDNRQYIVPNALIRFVAPMGYHFNSTNKLVPGTTLSPGDKEEIWATVISVENEGTAGGAITILSPDIEGPIKLNNFVPTGAIPREIIPQFSSDIPPVTEQLMSDEVELLRNFGLGFDSLTNTWYVIYADNLNENAAFSLVNAQDDSNTHADASWVVKFIATPSGYSVTARTLRYYFASILQTRFFFDNTRKIYDPKTGKVVNDFIKVLKTNTRPDGTNYPLTGDITCDIIDQIVESDGFVNDYSVEISYTDTDNDGIADDPDFFEKIVDISGTYTNNKVYFQATVDFDNLERYLPIESSLVNGEYATKDLIQLVKTEHANGQLFYAHSEDKFYELVVDVIGRTVKERSDMYAQFGRDTLQFQYKHNSPETRRINPGTTNIIDLYVVTSSYYNAYTTYIQDSTGTVEEPKVPTIDELTVAHEGLQSKKMISDNIVLNSVKFKPLFGDKAATNLQAYIKVVKLNNTVVSDSEIKSRVISTINDYFQIENWDFGDTFYFSELSAYLHAQLGDILGSVVIVPKAQDQSFGDLYEIKSAPYEIFTSAATVDDVNIIDALTASKLQNRVG